MVLILLKKTLVGLLIGVSIFSITFVIITSYQSKQVENEIDSAIEDYYANVIVNAKELAEQAKLIDTNKSTDYSSITSLIQSIEDNYKFFRLLNHYSDNLHEFNYSSREEGIDQLWKLLTFNEVKTEAYISTVIEGIDDEISHLESLK